MLDCLVRSGLKLFQAVGTTVHESYTSCNREHQRNESQPHRAGFGSGEVASHDCCCDDEEDDSQEEEDQERYHECHSCVFHTLGHILQDVLGHRFLVIGCQLPDEQYHETHDRHYDRKHEEEHGHHERDVDGGARGSIGSEGGAVDVEGEEGDKPSGDCKDSSEGEQVQMECHLLVDGIQRGMKFYK